MVDPAKGLREIARMFLGPDSAPSKMDMDDPFLNYFALGLLIFVVIVNLYGIITILRKLYPLERRTSSGFDGYQADLGIRRFMSEPPSQAGAETFWQRFGGLLVFARQGCH
jgi:hypothetical protein